MQREEPADSWVHCIGLGKKLHVPAALSRGGRAAGFPVRQSRHGKEIQKHALTQLSTETVDNFVERCFKLAWRPCTSQGFRFDQGLINHNFFIFYR